MCDYSLWQLTAPSLDLQEVQDLGGTEATQDPKEIRVLLIEQTSYSGTSKTSRLSVLCASRWSGTARVTRVTRVVHCSNPTQSAEEGCGSVTVPETALETSRIVNVHLSFSPFHQLQELKRVEGQRSIAVAPAVPKGQTCYSVLFDIYCFFRVNCP